MKQNIDGSQPSPESGKDNLLLEASRAVEVVEADCVGGKMEKNHGTYGQTVKNAQEKIAAAKASGQDVSDLEERLKSCLA